LFAEDGLPLAQVGLYAEPHAAVRETLVAAMKKLVQRYIRQIGQLVHGYYHRERIVRVRIGALRGPWDRCEDEEC
jgi:hypothetical protein